MEVEDYPEKDRFGMCLALNEALVNAVKHGNHSDLTKRVRVRHQVTAQRALVEVEDEGAGFDPRAVPDPCAPENLEQPGGRGLLLMRSYTTWVRFNPRGNRVTLYKRRSQRSSEHSAGTAVAADAFTGGKIEVDNADKKEVVLADTTNKNGLASTDAAGQWSAAATS